MKNLIIIVVILFGCTKQVNKEPVVPEEIETRVSRDVFTHVGVKTYWPPFETPNFTGVAFEAKVIDLRMQGDYTKSAWGAFNYRYLVNEQWQRNWVQIGWYQLKGSKPEFAFFIYRRSGPLGFGQEVPNIQYVDQSVTITEDEITRFEIKNIEGTTWWAVSLNGRVRFNVDLHTGVAGDFPPEVSSNNSIEFFTETRGGTTFSSVVHVNYIEYFKDGVWTKTPTGRTSGEGWNIEGQVQNPAFGISEFNIGGRGYLPSGSLIW